MYVISCLWSVNFLTFSVQYVSGAMALGRDDSIKNSFFCFVIPKRNSLPGHIVNQINSDAFVDLCKTHFSEN